MKNNRLPFKSGSIVVACILSSLLFSPARAAPLDDLLNGMFVNVTQPGAWSSQSRGGFVGGDAVVRIPKKTVNLLYVDPPRFSAGCGGMDFHMGSFSFINADEIVQVFRSIAQNAVGALFKMAIAAINSNLSQVMTDFQNEMARWSAMASNTCALGTNVAEALVNGPSLFDKLKKMNDEGTLEGAAKGAITSSMESFYKPFEKMFTGIDIGFKRDANGNITSNPSPKDKNIGHELLRQLKNAVSSTNSAGASDFASYDVIWYTDQLKRFRVDALQNIFGPLISNRDNTCKTTESVSTPVGNKEIPALDLDKCAPTRKSPIVQKWFDLIYKPSPTDRDFYGCVDRGAVSMANYDAPWTCVEVELVPATDPAYGFIGARGLVNNLMWGTNDDLDSLDQVVPSSILGIILSGKSTLSPQQQAIVNASPIPFIKLYKDVQGDPEAVLDLFKRASDGVATSTALMMLGTLEASAKLIVNAKPSEHLVKIDAEGVKNYEKFRDYVAAERKARAISIGALLEYSTMTAKYVEARNRGHRRKLTN